MCLVRSSQHNQSAMALADTQMPSRAHVLMACSMSKSASAITDTYSSSCANVTCSMISWRMPR